MSLRQTRDFYKIAGVTIKFYDEYVEQLEKVSQQLEFKKMIIEDFSEMPAEYALNYFLSLKLKPADHIYFQDHKGVMKLLLFIRSIFELGDRDTKKLFHVLIFKFQNQLGSLIEVFGLAEVFVHEFRFCLFCSPEQMAAKCANVEHKENIHKRIMNYIKKAKKESLFTESV